jgi:hypothetical protein
MTSESLDWWLRILADQKEKGRNDCEKGIYCGFPLAERLDTSTEEKHQYYKKGCIERRKELGEKFKWTIEK